MSTSVRSEELDVLFLLELLVDKVKVDKQPDVELGVKLRETVVVFRLMDFPPLIISEEDFIYLDNYEDTEINFKSGRSILFSLPADGPSANWGDHVRANVSRRAEPPPQPEQHSVSIGRAKIPLRGSFVDLMKESKIQNMASPSTKTIKGTYDMMNDSDAKTGDITVFLRLSCFGKLIVTEFEVKGPEASKFWFRGGPDTTDIKEREDKAQEQVPSGYSSRVRSLQSGASQQPYGPGSPYGGSPGGRGQRKSGGGRASDPYQSGQYPPGQGAGGQFQQGPMMPGPYGYPPQMYGSPTAGPMSMPPQYGQYNPAMMPMAPGMKPQWDLDWAPYGGGPWMGGGTHPCGGQSVMMEKSSSRCVTDRETQVEEGDFKGQPGDKKAPNKASKGSLGSKESDKKSGGKKKPGKGRNSKK